MMPASLPLLPILVNVQKLGSLTLLQQYIMSEIITQVIISAIDCQRHQERALEVRWPVPHSQRFVQGIRGQGRSAWRPRAGPARVYA